MDTIIVSISDDGTVRHLVSPEAQCFMNAESVVRRASHVEPVSILARIAFYVLRTLCGEYGRVASFTRLWPCMWRVNLSPVNGPILDTQYFDRQNAINAEIAWLNENFI